MTFFPEPAALGLTPPFRSVLADVSWRPFSHSGHLYRALLRDANPFSGP